MTSLEAKETAMKSIRLFAFIAACALALGCRESRLVVTPNATPVASARALGPDGKLTKGTVRFDYSGEDVEVTLDGTASTDSDGKIAKYIWLSGTAVPADGGVGNLSHDAGGMFVHAGGRLVPEGQSENWPDDKAKPVVKLGVGEWKFVLWVEDDRGGISDPSVITVDVGQTDPVQACVDSALQVVPEACLRCACSQSDTCRAALPMDKCDSMCWGLINCVATMCPSTGGAPDTACIGAMCTAYLSAASAATAAGGCLTACLSDCAPGGSMGH